MDESCTHGRHLGACWWPTRFPLFWRQDACRGAVFTFFSSVYPHVMGSRHGTVAACFSGDPFPGVAVDRYLARHAAAVGTLRADRQRHQYGNFDIILDRFWTVFGPFFGSVLNDLGLF